MDKSRLPLGTLTIFGVFVVVMIATWLLARPPAPPEELQGVLRADFRELTPFELTDHNGEVFDGSRLQDRWTFTFFGYTHCPDICPTTLYELNSMITLLEGHSSKWVDDIQVLFVSVDPDRDTVERLAEYVPYYGERAVGVTAQPARIDNLAAQFGAGYIFEEETGPGIYNVAHTSSIFLVDPFGRLVASFSQPHYAAHIATQYEKIREYFDGA